MLQGGREGILDGRRWSGTPLPEILRELQLRKATGILTVGSADVDREFLFNQGELRAARSSAESEKLGSWLVRHSLISVKQKERFLEGQEGSDAPPLGHILVAEEVLRQHTLERALEGLALEILEGATGVEKAELLFTQGREAGQLDTLPEMTTPQLILLSARVLGDFQAKTAAVGAEEQHVSLNAPLEEIVQEFDLAANEATLLGKLYLSRSLKDLRESAKMSGADFVNACYPLVISGLISLVPRPARHVSSHVSPSVTLLPDGEVSRVTAPAVASEADVIQIKKLFSRMERLDHYEFFGISAYANYQDIADAWANFDQRYHPSRSSAALLGELQPELEAIHTRAQEAYEILSNPIKRPRYDRSLRAAVAQAVPAPLVEETASAREVLVQQNLKEVESLLRREDFFSAIQLMETTTDLDPTPANLLKLAQLMMLNPRWTARALEKLKRALEIDPGFIDGWLLIAEHWRRRQSPERERKALERALVVDRGNSEALRAYESLVGAEACRRFLRRVSEVNS